MTLLFFYLVVRQGMKLRRLGRWIGIGLVTGACWVTAVCLVDSYPYRYMTTLSFEAYIGPQSWDQE